MKYSLSMLAESRSPYREAHTEQPKEEPKEELIDWKRTLDDVRVKFTFFGAGEEYFVEYKGDKMALHWSPGQTLKHSTRWRQPPKFPQTSGTTRFVDELRNFNGNGFCAIETG